MIWIYDSLVIRDLYIISFRNKENTKTYTFTVSEDSDDRYMLSRFLDEAVQALVGFNNLHYHYPILDYVMALQADLPKQDFLRMVYAFHQKIMAEDYTWVRPVIPQLDLFKIHHLDYKSISLPKVAFALGCEIYNEPESNALKEHFVINNTAIILALYRYSEDAISLRKDITDKGIYVMNASNVKIGSSIFLNHLSKRMGIALSEVRKLRTLRDEVVLSECILDYDLGDFECVLNWWNQISIVRDREDMYMAVATHNHVFTFTGAGIRQCNSPGHYCEDDEHVILDIDVKNFYASIAMVYDFSPEHLNYFGEIMSELVDRREATDNPAFKYAVVGVYGMSMSKHSFFYDMKYALSIVTNGQLMMAELIKELLLYCEFIQTSTDGITIRIRREHKEYFSSITSAWEKKFGMELKIEQLHCMWFKDANNYIAHKYDGELKLTGDFKESKEIHEGHDAPIIAEAAKLYLTMGLDVEKTIKNADPMKFMYYYQCPKEWHIQHKGVKDGDIYAKKYGRYIRYCVSKESLYIYKHKADKAELITKHKTTICNDVTTKVDIDYAYYINEANKLIKSTQAEFKLF